MYIYIYTYIYIYIFIYIYIITVYQGTVTQYHDDRCYVMRNVLLNVGEIRNYKVSQVINCNVSISYYVTSWSSAR